MTEQPFPHVFAPIKIGPIEIPNRLYLTPHGIGHVAPDLSAPGFWGPSPLLKDYFVERARGGLGLNIQGGTVVHPSSEYPGLWQMFSDDCVKNWAPVVDAVHEHGTKIFCQLMHAGHHGDKAGAWGGPLSSSTVLPIEGANQGGLYTPIVVPVKAMTKDDIQVAVEAFRLCTANARRAGYDGVELHASHSYLVEQFFSPFFNKRTDEYGGSLDNRLRFMWEVLEAMREAAAGEIAVGARLICDEMLPGGLGAEEMTEIAARLDASGLVDFFDLDVGTYHSFEVMIAPWELPDHWEVDHIAKVRSAIKNAVVLGCPGRFHDPAKAETLIASGALDMVGGTRGWFADPALAIKAKEGRANEIRPCIGLNRCGEGSRQCVMNPTKGLEDRWSEHTLSKADVSRRVLVVGGGPAGLEAARVAALRGHDVTLYEASDRVGGALHLMKAIPGREHVVQAAQWWEERLADLGVKVNLGTAVDADLVVGESPDVVVVATGAHFDAQGVTAFRSDPIAGWDRDFVHSPEAVLTGAVRLSGRVIVLDEETNAPGHGVAEILADGGADVELVTRHMAVGAIGMNGNHLPLVRQRLIRRKITMTANTYVDEIGDHTVTLYDVHTGERRVVTDVAGVVLVTGRVAVNGLAAALQGRVPALHVIGDAFHPRKMDDATRDGHRVARELI
ncbi:MAG: FAD-dependent oxidoreductase [Acidimicrobiia bacterium]